MSAAEARCEWYAHLHHNRAALASAFLVNSTPSSKAIGSIAIEHIPMTAKITNSAGALFGRTWDGQDGVEVGKRKPTSPDQGEPTDCHEWDEDLESDAKLMGEDSVEQWCSDD